MDSSTELDEKKSNNPDGKGGFGERPEDINAGGRPKNSLKSFVASKLAKMTEEEKEEFLKDMNKNDIWKMAEGSPHQTQDTTVEVTLPEPLLAGKSHGNNNSSNKQTTEVKEED